MKLTWSVVGILLVSQLFGQAFKPKVGLWSGVTMEAGSVEHVDFGLPTSHLLIDSTDRVAIKLINYFETRQGYFLVREFNDAGHVVMKRIANGPVSVYSFSSDEYNPYWIDGGARVNKHTYFGFEGEMYKLGSENLKRALSHHSGSLHEIKRINQRNFIKVGMVATGLVLTGVGLSQMYQPDEMGVNRFSFRPNAPFILGIPIIVFGFTFGKRNKITLMDVVRLYNNEH